MKKALPFLMVFIIFTMFNNKTANAYTDGIFDNQPIKLYPSGTTTRLTDNNLTTGVNIRMNYIYVVPSNATDLTHIYFQKTKSEIPVLLHYYSNQEKTQLIKTERRHLSTNGWEPINIKGVVAIDFKPSDTPDLEVFELDYKSDIPLDYFPILNLTETHNFNSVDLKWKNPNTTNVDSIIIKSNGIEVATLAKTSESYALVNLNPETVYNLEVIVKYIDGSFSASQIVNVTTDKKPLDTSPTGEITDMAFGASSVGVTFNWINPTDTDFSHVKVYRDGVLLENNIRTNEYRSEGLVPNTTYLFKFVTVDTSGNESSGYIQTIKTDMEKDNVAPGAPTGLLVTTGNQSGRLVWDKGNEVDLKGYNVYVNGIKHNSTMLLANNYILTGLENGVSYVISVTSVDTSDNESVKSTQQTLIPTKDTMPIFKANYDLKAVADGTSSWFTSFWPILAFAVGIPLAFYIAGRVKTLFFA